MADILFTEPFHFEMNVIETEEVLPSFRVGALIEVKSMSRQLRYVDDTLWIDCDDWDVFIDDLKKVIDNKKYEATLFDMSRKILFQLESKDGKMFIALNCSFSMDYKDRSNILSLKYEIDEGTFCRIEKGFRGFPIWWR